MNVYRNDSRGELDEVIVHNADVHVERMSEGEFCLNIRTNDKENVLMFFSSEDDVTAYIAEDTIELEDDTPDFKKE